MEAVGCSVLSTTLQVLFDRIAQNQEFLAGLFPGNKKLQLNRLIRVLRIVSPVLQDAENKQERSPSVKAWFNSIRHAVYRVDDVLDEINMQRSKGDLSDAENKQERCSTVKTWFNCFRHSKGDVSDTDFRDQFIGELSPTLEEICDALERKVQRIGVLGLRILYGNQKREDKRLSTSVVNKIEIFGRDDEKEEIIKMVLSGEAGTDISVIPITGMGGIGKTTLAQLVYNDERVKNLFQTRAWICISEEFDVYRATKDLLKEVHPSAVDEEDDLSCLQLKLKDDLQGKRFIIILDDIWNDNNNDCQNLMSPLSSGSRGSKIIVTTRNENIALMLQNEPFHHLKPIKDDQSWSLFKLHAAFDNRARSLSPEFEKVGRRIVEKCKGLPLAIKTIASALRSMSAIHEWQDILNNKNWMVAGDILPALSLGYKLLPSHLKCCFAFCAVFIKDVPFHKDEVALLWMANDLVQPSSHEVAQKYFEELRSRSFFDMVHVGQYVMHDLINDLARIVSGNFCARQEDYRLEDLHLGIQGENNLPPPEVLHFSYMGSNYDTLKRFRGLGQGLRTFLPIHHSCITTLYFSHILSKLRHVRALSLHQCSISSRVLYSIGHLKHLRFLNLASTQIKKLPNDIPKCMNLQTLILADCTKFEKWPEDMGLLIKLQYLNINGCSKLKKLPEDMGRLINLQHLDISYCVLLKELPKYMGRLINLQHLNINGCSKLKKLPEDMGRLINLQHLDISYCVLLKELPKDMGLLIKLQYLNIYGCSKLKKLPEDMGRLINLQHLDISYWVLLEELPKDMGLLIKLQYLNINGCSKLKKLPEDMGRLINLQHLDISYCVLLKELPKYMGRLINLQHLDISHCSQLKELPKYMGGLINLQYLNSSGCSELEKLPIDMGLLINLQRLNISDCSRLMELPKDMRHLVNLQYLNISGCWELEKLPEDMRNLINLQLYEVVERIDGDTLKHLDKLKLGQLLVISLNNEVTIEMAKNAELKNKNCIENLTLEWARSTQDELSIFAELVPHTNIRQLRICGYRGTTFSNWLGDSSFCNIEELTLKDCKSSIRLPPVGQLTGLKRLVISGMDGIREVGEEFYGNSSICKPFQVLEELIIEKMAEWTTWNMHPDNADFLSLKKFQIEKCPKLVGDIPFHLTLRTLEMKIKYCPSICLYLQSCDLKRLEMRNCKHVEFMPDDICNSSLEYLEISSCGVSTETIPLFSFSKLQELSISSLKSPSMLKIPNGYHQSLTSLQELRIYYCDNILSFPEGGLPAPNLKFFSIWSCKRLKSLPEQMHTQLSSLQDLQIEHCPEMECFPDGGLPPSLERLKIHRCKKLMMFPRNWGLQTLPSLIELDIGGIEDKLFPEEGLLPASLKDLIIGFCPNLEALNHKGFQYITSLQILKITFCPELRYLPEEGLPSSLSILDILRCRKLAARIEREKGEDWPKVKSIPIIDVDGELIS